MKLNHLFYQILEQYKIFESIFLVHSTDAYFNADVMDYSKDICCQTPRDCRNRQHNRYSYSTCVAGVALNKVY